MIRTILLVLIASICCAQNGSQLRDWKPANDPRVRPKLVCADLRSLTAYDFTIITATQIAATADVPEHCRVSGQILPEIAFEVNLPAAWNRRFYMFGNGGYAGESFDAAPRIATRDRAVTHGFAVAANNTGHDSRAEPLGSFAVNRQKLFDYAFRSLHVTADAAKKLIETYYGIAAARSYFDGCSTGGRQGLILAQRFPRDFDGIIVGAPVLNFSGTMVSYTWMAQALAASPVPFAKLKLLADRVTARCDEQDGLKDGIIDSPLRCGFSPSHDLPRCPGESEAGGCFTAAQISSLEKIYSDVAVNGKRLFPGWPVGAEVLGPNGRSGWENWLIREKGPTISVAFAETFFRYLAFPEKDANYDLSRFNWEKDPSRLAWIRSVLDATDPDLTRFRDRGGKIVMYYGWADPALNARMGVEYYESVLERMGTSTSGFFRLFMVPGMFHCRGGVGTDTFDCLTPLMRWVEDGKAPATISAARLQEGKVIRTRPLCPYPEIARYNGTGSIDDAANFTCSSPPGPGQSP